MYIIKPVTTKKERKQFIEFQNELYADCPQYVPMLFSDEMANLDPEKNPAFDYCDMQCFLCMDGDKVVGRICGLIHRRANTYWKKKQIRFCRMDFIDNQEVSELLLKTVEDWGRSQGMTEIIGPIGFCDADKEGMLVEGFEHKSMFITYYNYEYYPEHMQSLGYEKEVDWVENKIYTKHNQFDRLDRLANAVMKRSELHMVENLKKKDLKEYVRRVFELINREYADLYGYMPLTDRQIEYYAAQFIILLNMRYVSLIEDKNNQLVGLGIIAPSLVEALIKNKGKLFPFGWIPVLSAIRKPKVLEMYFVAVTKEYQKSGLTAVIMRDLIRNAQEDGIQFAETGPELEHNDDVRSMWDGFEAELAFKRRRCYIKTIGN